MLADDDVELVRYCLRDDPSAIRALVERYQSDVFGLCVRLLHHRHDAEDVTQEVFLRVFRSLRRWDGTRPLKPWIMGITVNRCRTHAAKRAKRPELADYLADTTASPGPAPDADDAAELRAELGDALAALRFEYRSAFVMYHEHGASYEDIADALERPVGTIKTWLHRARAELLDRLRRRGMVPEDAPADPRGTP